MSDVKQRNTQKDKSGSSAASKGSTPKTATRAERASSGLSRLFPLLFLLFVIVPGYFAMSYYSTGTFTFGLTMDHLRDPHKLMATFHGALKSSGLPNFHGSMDAASATINTATGEKVADQKPWGAANSDGQEVAEHQVSKLKIFSPKELERYDGENGRPLFVGVKGRVYDVTKGRAFYGKDGMYSIMGAKDATLYLSTGCSDDACVKEKVPDMMIDSMTDEMLEGADSWIKTYNKKYTLVGFIKNRFERWNYPEAASMKKQASKV